MVEYFYIGLILGVFLITCLNKILRKIKRRNILKKAKNAEKRSLNILLKKGYKIIDIQKRRTVNTIINGQETSNTVIADIIAKKHGKLYAIEVKTGKQLEADLLKPQIRRQLLEYKLAFKVDGIILLDMNEEELYSIEFPFLNNKLRDNKLILYFIFFILGLVSYHFYTKFLN